MIDQNKTATALRAAATSQTSAALLIQVYAVGIKEQPLVDFSNEPHLLQYQDAINDGLNTAKDHAANYLTLIQPALLRNIFDISNYYALHNAIPSVCPEGTTVAQWIANLTELQIASTNYLNNITRILATLTELEDELKVDVEAFRVMVQDLNTAVNGDGGILQQDANALAGIQTRIDVAIAAMTLGIAAMIGGVIMIIIGAVAPVALPLVVGGVSMLGVGTTAMITSAVLLADLNNEKAQLLYQESQLNAEVTFAMGVSSGYKSWHSKVSDALGAAKIMFAAWQDLDTDLTTMISELNSGITSPDALRKAFLDAANSEIATVVANVNTIKLQMDGIQTVVATPGQSVGDAVLAVAKQHQASARMEAGIQ